jgi:type I restriction enzyme R subunit
MSSAQVAYLDMGNGNGQDERLERAVYGRFLDPDSRKTFYGAYKDIESLWEILSPSPELREHIVPFQQLARLYAAVRNAYAEKIGFVADLAYKTRRLIEENATQSGLGRLTKSVTFDVETLEALREEKGPDEGKVFNLVRGLQKEIDDDPGAAPVLQPLKDRAERILKDLENRKTTALAAMDMLGALAAEKEAAAKAAAESGLSTRAFSAFWTLKDNEALKAANISAMELAREIEALSVRFPNAAVNPDEQRRFRASLYRPLLSLPQDRRARVVDLIVVTVFGEQSQ